MSLQDIVIAFIFESVQEIEMLLLDVIKKRVSEELKKRQQTKKWRKRWAQSGEKSGSSSESFTQPQILTGW